MLKDAIQSALKPFNVKLARIPRHVLPVVPFDVFEYVLFKTLQDAGDAFRFIQVGANDGVLNDNLAPLIRKYRMRGCLVEPMADVFQRLKANYGDQPQLDFRQCMIGSGSESGTIYRFKPDAPVPAAFFHGLARQDSSYIVKRAENEGLSQYVEKVECPMRTFAELYGELAYDRLDLLYVDTEGSDDAIVYQALEAGLRPAIINFEWTEMPLERNYRLKMKLLDEGYRFIDVGADTICVRQQL